ncbi:hypothetical protein ANTQUA_LOCUS9790 [Anthophora quadrimaculata]
MAKRKLPQEVFCETENSDEEFYFDLLNTDSDRERQRLVAQLVGDFRNGAESKPGRLSTSDKKERLNGKLHILRHCENVKSKDCCVCSNRKIKGGRHQTNYFCDTCTRKPGLHVGECFEKYHTIKNYKT